VSGFESQNVHVVEPLPRDITVGPVTASGDALAPLPTLFLDRLSRLLHQEQEWRRRVAGDDWRLRLIHHAIYTTYCDCIAQGLTDRARDLIQQDRSIVPLQPTNR
jgi:hypothetical protein